MTINAVVGGRLDLGRVAERTFASVTRRFGADYGVALLFGGVPALLAQWLLLTSMANVRTNPGATLGFAPLSILMAFISLVGVILLNAAISWGAVEDQEGRAPGFAAMLRACQPSLVVLLVGSILAYIGFVIGLVLLVAPAFYLMTLWVLFFPVAMRERTDIMGTFRGSAELTRGHRWMVLLLVVVFWIGAAIYGTLVSLIVHAIFGGVGGGFFGLPRPGAATAGVVASPLAYVGAVVSVLAQALVNMVGAVLVGVLYVELRTLRGGFDARSLSEVFA